MNPSKEGRKISTNQTKIKEKKINNKVHKQ